MEASARANSELIFYREHFEKEEEENIHILTNEHTYTYLIYLNCFENISIDHSAKKNCLRKKEVCWCKKFSRFFRIKSNLIVLIFK